MFFLYLLLTHKQSNHQYISQANKFILDIQNGRYTGITSTLTQAEYRGVIKKRISEKFNSQVSLYQEESAMVTLYQHLWNRTSGR
jgi:predicted nucleic acid-binding protein